MLIVVLLLLMATQVAEAGEWVSPKVSAPDPVTQQWHFRPKNIGERAEDMRLCAAVEAKTRASGLIKAEAPNGSVELDCMDVLGYRWKEQ